MPTGTVLGRLRGNLRSDDRLTRERMRLVTAALLTLVTAVVFGPQIWQRLRGT